MNEQAAALPPKKWLAPSDGRVPGAKLMVELLEQYALEQEQVTDPVPEDESVGDKFRGRATLPGRVRAVRAVMAGEVLPPYRQVEVESDERREEIKAEVWKVHLFCEVGPMAKLDPDFAGRMALMVMRVPRGKQVEYVLHAVSRDLTTTVVGEQTVNGVLPEGSVEERVQVLGQMYTELESQRVPSWGFSERGEMHAKPDEQLLHQAMVDTIQAREANERQMLMLVTATLDSRAFDGFYLSSEWAGLRGQLKRGVVAVGVPLSDKHLGIGILKV